MEMKNSWYRINDKNPNGAFQVLSIDEAYYWNERGFGIFQTVNEFIGQRKIENLVRINSWAIDIDHGTKQEQLEKIESSGMYPSMIVETKKGHHVYFHSIDATKENYQAIVFDRLIPYFNADKNARDAARLLRVPGFYHHKGSPFLISLIVCNVGGRYSEKEMRYVFRLTEENEKESQVKQELRKVFGHNDNLWERVFTFDCDIALNRLSGTSYVKGEIYSFRKNSNGNLNIHVDGKSTSCFIDKNKRIGSLSGGGPTIASWLKWYGGSWHDVILVMRKVFPELWN